MKKRAYKRIPTSINARFFCDGLFYPGTVTNLSENGMCIHTRVCFPIDSMFDVLIPMKKEVLNVPVKISRIEKTEDFCDTMGVEVLNSPENYLEFVDNLRFALIS